MKISLENYNPDWTKSFREIKSELLGLIGFMNPSIEHIGSTAVEGLSAKPIIDILVGVNNDSDLEKVVIPLVDKNYVYYEKYNTTIPYRRFFVKHKINPKDLLLPAVITGHDTSPETTLEHSSRLAHIHVIPTRSEHWLRHIAFRDYLRMHPSISAQYQQLKEQLSAREWVDGNEYNKAKDEFLKAEERKALHWYTAKF